MALNERRERKDWLNSNGCIGARFHGSEFSQHFRLLLQQNTAPLSTVFPNIREPSKKGLFEKGPLVVDDLFCYRQNGFAWFFRLLVVQF